MIVIIAVLFALAGYFNYIMDTLQFRYSKSIFATFDNQEFWNPAISWRNKYKEVNSSILYNDLKPKFIGSTTFLVALTDGWHLSKWLMFSCIEIAVSIPIVLYYGLGLWFILVGWMVFKSVRGLTFSLFFK